jgi:hypothetical protein
MTPNGAVLGGATTPRVPGRIFASRLSLEIRTSEPVIRKNDSIATEGGTGDGGVQVTSVSRSWLLRGRPSLSISGAREPRTSTGKSSWIGNTSWSQTPVATLIVTLTSAARDLATGSADVMVEKGACLLPSPSGAAAQLT